MDLLKAVENEQLEKLARNRPIPEFGPGDTVRVSLKVVEGSRERVQVYEGVCIARRNRGLNSSFTVRKISSGEGVERVFPLYSPAIAGIEVVRRGRVRRAKLYYLRGRTGRAARIVEKATRVTTAEPAKAKGAGGEKVEKEIEGQEPEKKDAKAKKTKKAKDTKDTKETKGDETKGAKAKKAKSDT